MKYRLLLLPRYEDSLPVFANPTAYEGGMFSPHPVLSFLLIILIGPLYPTGHHILLKESNFYSVLNVYPLKSPYHEESGKS